MAQTALSRSFLCQTCARLAVQGNKNQTRSFASTPSAAKTALPSFTPTSSPELDSILSEFRSKVFTPATLSNRHRDLIYRPRNHSKLTADPVIISVGENEDYQLLPKDFFDQPKTKQSLAKMLELMKEPQDWSNMVPFLQGLALAKRKLAPGQMAQIARKASEAGAQTVLASCVRRAKSTAFSLEKLPAAREVMLGFHTKAAAAEFQGEQLQAAFNQAESVAQMMEMPVHCGGKILGAEDPRKRPEIVGILLELSAAKALDASIAAEGDGEAVLNYSKRLVATSSYGDYTLDGTMNNANEQLILWLPVWHGLKLALRVPEVSRSVRSPLEAQKEQLEELIEKAYAALSASSGGKPRRGLQMYQDLFASR